MINLYPKTSCACWECKQQYPIQKKGVKSNLSVRGCQVPKYFDCYDRVELNTSQQPVQNSVKPKNWKTLNPQAYMEKIAEGFYNAPDKTAGCRNKGFLSNDPRQFDTLRDQKIPLDRPPADGNVHLVDVYNPKWNGYGSGFKGYEDINDGDITYYLDRSISDAFYHPVYSEPCKETTVLYRDPMGGCRTQHTRTPLINTANPTITTAERYPYCLSWLQDSQSQREDIISWQQRKHNESKWSARWGSLDY